MTYYLAIVKPNVCIDFRYWARRLKNNQAAKRSRDMRIQREKIIFDENSRLEGQNKELRRDVDQLTTGMPLYVCFLVWIFLFLLTENPDCFHSLPLLKSGSCTKVQSCIKFK